MDSYQREKPAAKTRTFDHFLLTRFNVRSFYHSEEPTDQWLRERLDLFTSYCLPSVAGQTTGNFTWLVFFDSLTPEWFRAEIAQISVGLFEPVYVEGAFDAGTVARELSRRATASQLVTTRLDNDDAVAKDFIELIQSCVGGQDREFINLVNGAQYAAGHAFTRPYTKNPFLTLVESRTDTLPATVFAEHHYRVDRMAPVRNIRSSHPMWLQVVHGGNVLNEIVGLRVAVRRIEKHFSCTLVAGDHFPDLQLGILTSGLGIVIRLAKKPARLFELKRTMFAEMGQRTRA